MRTHCSDCGTKLLRYETVGGSRIEKQTVIHCRRCGYTIPVPVCAACFAECSEEESLCSDCEEKFKEEAL